MSWLACTHLNEVRNALAQGHWPQASTPELQAHVAACPRCAQEVLLTQHLQQARAEAIEAAAPVAPSLLWWRAQARRRNAALVRAARPLAAAHAFALVLFAATLVGIVVLNWQSILDRVASAPAAPAAWSLTAVVADWGLAPLAFAVALITTLGGVVVYLTTQRQ
jgi:hypothetical protein